MCYPGGYPGSRSEPLLLKDLADVVFDGALGDRGLLGWRARPIATPAALSTTKTSDVQRPRSKGPPGDAAVGRGNS
jgi:hypothetical protein